MAKRIDAVVKMSEDFLEDLISKVVEYGQLGAFPERRLAEFQYGADAMLEKEPDVFKVFNFAPITAATDIALYRPPPGKRIILLIQGTSMHGGTGSQAYFFREDDFDKDYNPFYVYERKMGNIAYHQYRYGKRGVQFKQNEALMVHVPQANQGFSVWLGMKLIDGDR